MARHRRRRSRQTEIQFRTWGGARELSGRKKVLPGKPRVAHRARPKLASRFPVHVTTRIRDDVPRLRNRKRCQVLRAAMLAVSDEPGFRICEFSVQGSHLHLICEAEDNAALARGMKRFKLRVARGLNRQLNRRGSVFLDRYAMTILTTPRQTRNCLCYVLHNARRHGERLPGVDPYSSARWFSGWADDSWRHGLSPPPERKPCVSPAQTWLLTTGWRRHGLIRITETPASAPSDQHARPR